MLFDVAVQLLARDLRDQLLVEVENKEDPRYVALAKQASPSEKAGRGVPDSRRLDEPTVDHLVDLARVAGTWQEYGALRDRLAAAGDDGHRSVVMFPVDADGRGVSVRLDAAGHPEEILEDHVPFHVIWVAVESVELEPPADSRRRKAVKPKSRGQRKPSDA